MDLMLKFLIVITNGRLVVVFNAVSVIEVPISC